MTLLHKKKKKKKKKPQQHLYGLSFNNLLGWIVAELEVSRSEVLDVSSSHVVPRLGDGWVVVEIVDCLQREKERGDKS